MAFTVLHYFVLIGVNVSITKRVVIVIILVTFCLTIYCLSVVKKREPKDEQLCITVHNNICDADSQDNASNKTQLRQ